MHTLFFKKRLSVKLVFLLFVATAIRVQAQNKQDTIPAVMVYKKIDTLSLKLHVFKPVGFDASKKYPAIVFFFGGGWINGNIQQFQKQALYLASRGMVTILADYRVKSRHNTTPFEAVADGKSAIRYARAHAAELNIDPNRIAAAGGSAGGHVAAATDLTKLDEPHGFFNRGEAFTKTLRETDVFLKSLGYVSGEPTL